MAGLDHVGLLVLEFTEVAMIIFGCGQDTAHFSCTMQGTVQPCGLTSLLHRDHRAQAVSTQLMHGCAWPSLMNQELRWRI